MGRDNVIKTLIVFIIFLASLFVWTKPINEMPFGEGDAAVHIGTASYMAYSDSSFLTLPFFLNAEFKGMNAFSPLALWYPPQFHTSLATAASWAENRIISMYYMIAIFVSLAFFSTYLLIKRFYGFFPAILASLFVIFSSRFYVAFLWGQWPNAISFAFVPLVLYSFIMALHSFKDDKYSKYIYLFLITLAAQFLIHPLGSIVSVAVSGVFFIVWSFKERKIVFADKTKFIKKGAVYTAIFLLIIFLCAPYQSMSFFVQLTGKGSHGDVLYKESSAGSIGLFNWYADSSYYNGYPSWLFSFKEAYNGYWSVAFLLLGLLFLLFRRKEIDILLLSWIVSLFLLTHLSFVGINISGYLPRIYYSESLIFAALCVVGIIGVASLIPSKFRKQAKYALLLIFFVLMLFQHIQPANTSLENAYKGIARINLYQMQLVPWITNNVPESSFVGYYGAPNYLKAKFTNYISFRLVAKEGNPPGGLNITNDYIAIDYSDIRAMGYAEGINQLSLFEQSVKESSELVYNTELIKVYKLGKGE